MPATTIVTHKRPPVTAVNHVVHLLGNSAGATIIPLVHNTASNTVIQTLISFQPDL